MTQNSGRLVIQNTDQIKNQGIHKHRSTRYIQKQRARQKGRGLTKMRRQFDRAKVQMRKPKKARQGSKPGNRQKQNVEEARTGGRNKGQVLFGQ